MSEDTKRIAMTIQRDVAKAYLILVESSPGAAVTYSAEFWVPKSKVVDTDCWAAGDKGYMELPKWILDKQKLWEKVEEVVSTTDEMAELEAKGGTSRLLREAEGGTGRLQREAEGGTGRLAVVVGINIDSLPANQGDMQVTAYLTDEGLAVDVFHGASLDTIATGYELFGEAGLHPPAPIEPRTIYDTIRDEIDEEGDF